MKNVVQTIDILNYKGGFALVLEDFPGIPLNRHFSDDKNLISGHFDNVSRYRGSAGETACPGCDPQKY